MNFSILNPLPPRTRLLLFGVVCVSVCVFEDCGCFVWIQTWVLNSFFLHMDPPNPWWGPGSQLRVPSPPPPPPNGPLLVTTAGFKLVRLVGLFSST